MLSRTALLRNAASKRVARSVATLAANGSGSVSGAAPSSSANAAKPATVTAGLRDFTPAVSVLSRAFTAASASTTAAATAVPGTRARTATAAPASSSSAARRAYSSQSPKSALAAAAKAAAKRAGAGAPQQSPSRSYSNTASAAAAVAARVETAAKLGAAFGVKNMGHPALWAPQCARTLSSFTKVGRVEGKTAPDAQLRKAFPEYKPQAADSADANAAAHSASSSMSAPAATVAAAAAAKSASAAASAESAAVSKGEQQLASARAFVAQAKHASSSSHGSRDSDSGSSVAQSQSDGSNGGSGGSDKSKSKKGDGFRWGRFFTGLTLSAAAAVAAAVALDERIGMAIKDFLGLDPIHDHEEDDMAGIAVMPVIPAPDKPFEHPLNQSSWFRRTWFRITRLCTLALTFLPLGVAWFKLWRSDYDPEVRKAFLATLVACLERAGCSFLKFGQWLSMRPDMFPPDVIEVLSGMRDNAPSHPLSATRDMIRQHFHCELEEMFCEFEPAPVASGSIAQVYRARLSPEWAAKAGLHDERGRPVSEVAVKVRHPAVLDETWMDVDLIFGFVNNSAVMAVPFSKDEFSRMMQKQVDFNWEGHYLTRFAYNFREEVEHGHLRFPAVSKNLLSESVLIEAWAQGKSVANIFTSVGDGFLAPGQVADHSAATVDQPVIDGLADGTGAPLVHTEPEPSVWERARDWGRGKREEFQAMTEALLPAKVVRQARRARRALLREGEDEYDLTALSTDPLAAATDGHAFNADLMIKKKRLAFTMFDMFLKMFLRDNLIHGDLHAGNVLFDTAHSACTVLDAGLTVSLDKDMQAGFGKFLLAICSGSPVALVERITDFEVSLPGQTQTSGKGKLALDPAVRQAFSKDIDAICEKFFQTSKFMGVEVGPRQRPKNVSIGDVVGQVLLTMQRHGVVLRGDVATSIMAMSVCEGLIRQLDPTLDIVLKSLPYFVKYKGFSSVSAITL